ncbi:MAG: cysteine--tRNA ligase [Elusimicrobia bacterium]|nr:cysteine--tRNA ligase [Elusimicrobiota bacterium]
MRIFNTLSRSLEELQPLAPPRVGIYTCGPTVYNYQHVGNYRTYIFEDVLVRTLQTAGFQVRRVMNITDVGHLTSDSDTGEDKLEVGAKREGKTAWDIAAFYTQAFLKDIASLDVLPADVLCKATDHIPEQISLVAKLAEKGLTYRISDGIYFDTGRFPAYGKLDPARLKGQKAGARVDVVEGKKNPEDFALWKFTPPGQKRHMEWDSPWGKGFPGWHIECSAMAMKYLGESFDIHCGGVDHISIHHTNEIAQAEGATGKPFVRYWLHGEFLLMNSAKMAKSAGGFVTLADLKEKGFDPLDYRYHCYTAHYRKQLDFTWELLASAQTSRRRLREAAAAVKGGEPMPACPAGLETFRAAVEDDLNMPGAVAAVWDCLHSDAPDGAKKALVEEAEKVLALGLFKEEAQAALSAEDAELVDRRAQARAAKDFKLSDELRKQLDSRGILVEDTKQGQRWRRK